jgi:hypothetical protein
MRKAVASVGVIIALSGGVAVTTGRFLHPELTETQLFLRLWPIELVICAGAVLLVLGMRMK